MEDQEQRENRTVDLDRDPQRTEYGDTNADANGYEEFGADQTPGRNDIREDLEEISTEFGGYGKNDWYRDINASESEKRENERMGEDEDLALNDYLEESSAELTAPVVPDRTRDNDAEAGDAVYGRGIGYVGLALSILSLFMLPVLFGAAGIVLGFMARRRDAGTVGAWAIGIGIVSIIWGIFIRPFF